MKTFLKGLIMVTYIMLGMLVAKLDWEFTKELFCVILPSCCIGSVLFYFYDDED